MIEHLTITAAAFIVLTAAYMLGRRHEWLRIQRELDKIEARLMEGEKLWKQ